jgi:hypothetical protein
MLRLFKVNVNGKDREPRFESKMEAKALRDEIIKDGKKGARVSRAEDHWLGASRRASTE